MIASATHAQEKSKVADKKKLFLPQAYLGNSEYYNGAIKKDVLSNLLKQGLTSKDAAGNKYKVTGFEFAYSERALYEDSIGNLQVLVDYMFEYCPGDTLSPGVSSVIYDRFKVGDTVFFNRIHVLKPNSGSGEVVSGKGMKFVITK
jgi:hypothetical protein